MTAVHPYSRFQIISESKKKGRSRVAQQTRREVSVVSNIDVRNDVNNDVTADIRDQSNKEFCGEPLADSGELLRSISPLTFSMKLFGLYFHREKHHGQRGDDPEWTSTRTPTTSTSKWLRVYATIMLIIVWFNYIRFISVFTRRDRFGALLLMKSTMFTHIFVSAIVHATYYYACHSGRLLKILLTLPVTRDCVRGAHRVAIGLTALVWITMIGDMFGGMYIFLSIGEEYNFVLAPFYTYTAIPKYTSGVVKVFGYAGYLLHFPGILFAHSLSVVLVFVFYTEFQKLKKNFRRALGDRGQFLGDLSSIRRRHQMLSEAVSKIDGFMKFSNVAGFVCHIANIIFLLYSLIFYPESTKSLISAISYVFYLFANISGLFFSTSAGIIINHMVCKSNLRIIILAALYIKLP